TRLAARGGGPPPAQRPRAPAPPAPLSAAVWPVGPTDPPGELRGPACTGNAAATTIPARPMTCPVRIGMLLLHPCASARPRWGQETTRFGAPERPARQDRCTEQPAPTERT